MTTRIVEYRTHEIPCRGQTAVSNSLRDLFAAATLGLIFGCAGCGKPADSHPALAEGESLWQQGTVQPASKLVGTNIDELSVPLVPALDKPPAVTDATNTPASVGQYPVSPDPATQDPVSHGLIPRPPVAFPSSATKHAGRPPLLAVTLRSGQVQGLPIGLFSDKTLLMRTNGSIVFLDKQQILGHLVTDQPFAPQDIQPLIDDLQTEFGHQYRVRSSHPYLVIAKPNRISTWCERFERIHQSIRLYCTTHRIPTRALEFPLIAVVLGSRRDFEQYAKLEGADLPSNCVGYYSQKSNRIVLFENEVSGEVQSTLETISHEATHQFAFNSGLHQRLAATPLWVMEGFAVQFEAPAYSNYASRDRASFWPTSQRQAWEALKQDRRKLQSLCQELIVSDTPFKTDTLNAYTAAWAMNTYLAQRRVRNYVPYLNRIASMRPFEEYSEGDRLRDFSDAFGSDLGIVLRETIAHLDRMR